MQNIMENFFIVIDIKNFDDILMTIATSQEQTNYS